MSAGETAPVGLMLMRSPVRDGHFELCDPAAARRVLASPAVVAELAVPGSPSHETVIRMLADRGVGVERLGSTSQTWMPGPWTIPLHYLVASQRAEFFDSGSGYRAAQATALEGYVAARPLPMADALLQGERAYEITPRELPERQVGDAMLHRRTPGSLRGGLALEVLEQVLGHTFEYPRRHRHPEAGSDFREYFKSFGSAFDVLVLVADVAGAKPGVYWYSLTENALLRIEGADAEAMHASLEDLSNGQGVGRGAAAAVVLVARLDRYRWRYRHDRALRNVFVEAGRLGQRCALIAEVYGAQTWFFSPVGPSAVRAHIDPDDRDVSAVYGILLGGPMDDARMPETVSG